jgi:hypothetical protein
VQFEARATHTRTNTIACKPSASRSQLPLIWKLDVLSLLVHIACVVAARGMQADYLSAVSSYDPFGMFGKVQKLNVLPLFIVAVLVSKTRPEPTRACKPTCTRTHTHASENTHAHTRTRNLASQPNCQAIKLTKQFKSVTRTQLVLSAAAFGM